MHLGELRVYATAGIARGGRQIGLIRHAPTANRYTPSTPCCPLQAPREARVTTASHGPTQALRQVCGITSQPCCRIHLPPLPLNASDQL
jgi:hypothetical protein